MPGLKLVEIHREDIETLPELMGLSRPASQRFIVFCDDLSFDADDTSLQVAQDDAAKAASRGGRRTSSSTRPRTAATMMARDMIENERSTAINPGEAVEEKVSLSDRFGLWLGFHRCSQDESPGHGRGYVVRYRVPIKGEECAAKRSNGRQRVAPAPAASPGNTCRTSRVGLG